MEKNQFDDYDTESLKSATLQKKSVTDKTACEIVGFYLPNGNRGRTFNEKFKLNFNFVSRFLSRPILKRKRSELEIFGIVD